MERFRYDRSSKWLIEHHGDLILRLGDVRDVEQWRAVQPEVVQPRQLPDGLLEVRRRNEQQFHPYIIEIETYPDPSTSQQLVDDIMLVYQDRRELPDVLVLVLRPKGNLRIAGETALRSRAGTAFAHPHRGSAENVLRECRRIIDEKSTAQEHDNLLAVSQVLLSLNYNDARLFAILGGREAMIESPVLEQFVAEHLHRAIRGVLSTRFGSLPPELEVKLGTIIDDDRLQELVKLATSCLNLEAFQRELG